MSSPDKNATRVLVDDKTYNVMSVRNGGMGKVWLLERAFEETGDPVYKYRIAVKTFDFVSDSTAIERELNVWITLQHRFVLPLLKLGRLNYQVAAIMPRMDWSLDDLLEEGRVFSEQETALIVFEIALALDYAWKSAGVLHLDIKPSNILVADQRALQIKVADWGISRLVSQHQTAKTKAWTKGMASNSKATAYAAGTPLFMCPERFTNSWQMTPAVDIYALGLMAILLNTGVLPFHLGQIDPIEEICSGALVNNARVLLVDRTSRFQKFCLGSLDPNPQTRLAAYPAVLKQLESLTKG